MTPSLLIVIGRVVVGGQGLAVILPMLPLLVAKSKRLLLLSGILVEQEESILKALRNLGCEETLVRKDGEWISVLAVRSHA